MELLKLRELPFSVRKRIRNLAISKYDEVKNVSLAAREIGVHRQVLHRWIKEFREGKSSKKETRGRKPMPVLYKAQTRNLLKILQSKIPKDVGINAPFWSVGSVGKIISRPNIAGTTYSPYLIKNILKDVGFPLDKVSNLRLAWNDMENLTLYDLQCKLNKPCYYVIKTGVKKAEEHYEFYCVLSARGDLRFISDKNVGLYHYPLHFFIQKIQHTVRKKIVIVCDSNLRCGWYGMYQYSLFKYCSVFKYANGILTKIH